MLSASGLAVLLGAARLNAMTTDDWQFTGCLWADVESAYLSSSGTICDSRPTALQNLDWDISVRDLGHLWGYASFLSMLHDGQHELHRPAFNEFEGGLFYGYDWRVSDSFTLRNSAGGVWNPLFGYRNGNDVTLWEYRYFQSLENPFLTPFWDILGLVSPTPSWLRIRFGVRRSFNLTDALVLTPMVESVWGDSDRFRARYGESPDHTFLGGAFPTATMTLKLEWFWSKQWSAWVAFREFVTIDPQARAAVKRKSEYWEVNDLAIFTFGVGYWF